MYDPTDYEPDETPGECMNCRMPERECVCCSSYCDGYCCDRAEPEADDDGIEPLDAFLFDAALWATTADEYELTDDDVAYIERRLVEDGHLTEGD